MPRRNRKARRKERGKKINMTLIQNKSVEEETPKKEQQPPRGQTIKPPRTGGFFYEYTKWVN